MVFLDKKLLILFVMAILLSLYIWKDHFWVSAEFKSKPTALANCPLDIFNKSAMVFNALTICATDAVSQKKLRHAAHVAAQWLDNDGDGKSDNPIIDQHLRAQKATIVMAFEEFNAVSDKLFQALEAEQRFGQDLYAVETNNPTRRDASQEEIHHLIIGAGWAAAFPQIFEGQSKISAVYHAWKIADNQGFYQYFDPICDDHCKVMEFIYKSTAAYLGAMSDLADAEFTLKSRSEVRQKLPSIIEIYESAEYRYPSLQWPDGRYPYTDNIIYLP